MPVPSQADPMPLLFGLILVSSLGTLAFVNAKRYGGD
jgi:hypothetical protein